jgi:hypothetical protein
VGWDHDLLNPIVEGLVDLMPWPRRLFSVSAPSEVYISDAAIVQFKQCIVGSARVSKGGELYAVQWMTG